MRNMVLSFCTTFLLSWDHFGMQQFSHEADQVKQTSFSVRLLVCLHVDILSCHFSKPQRTQEPNAQRKCFIWTLLMFSRPPTVTPLLSINPFRRPSELRHKHLHFTVSTSRQTVAWHQISLSFSGFLSPLSLFFSSYSTIFITTKSTSADGIRKLKIEHITVWLWRCRGLSQCFNRRHAYSEFPSIPFHSH